MHTAKDRPTAIPEVDEEGFLTKGDTWNEDIAQLLAQERMQEALSDDHWRIINYMRQYYLDYGSVPPVRKLSRDTAVSLRQLKALFPDGLTRGACRISGIPRHIIKPSFLYP